MKERDGELTTGRPVRVCLPSGSSGVLPRHQSRVGSRYERRSSSC